MLSYLIDQLKSNKGFLPAIASSVLLYFLFAYELERSDFVLLLTLWVALFACTFLLIEKSGFHFWILAGIGVLFRFIFMPTLPTLSQDFYRFLWDGRMLLEGVSPYIVTPSQFISDDINLLPYSLRDHPLFIPNASELVRGMGSLNASHYSNYPPINQFFFLIAALFFKNSIIGSVIVLRSIMILADIGILWIGKKLLEALNLPIKNIFWYFLNPFIIIEFTGNLHFEGVMLFFLITALYLLHQKKWINAGIFFGISIATKLLPLLFLPLLWKQNLTDRQHNSYSWFRIISLYAVIGVTLLVCFLPFVSSEFIQNFSATLGLWFQTFEFNASIYYMLRWIGFQ
ncbi:MAG: DUF2029 domain-containing protein, partial [Flavobacteriaceae bacterium]|nr:DUF2029 domain-containing protein [Flavobacteriaceae bacterium]